MKLFSLDTVVSGPVPALKGPVARLFVHAEALQAQLPAVLLACFQLQGLVPQLELPPVQGDLAPILALAP